MHGVPHLRSMQGVWQGRGKIDDEGGGADMPN